MEGKVDEKICGKKVGKRRLKKAISSKKKQEKRKEANRVNGT